MVTKLLFSNNAKTTLAGAISAGATALNVAPGAGALFPNPNVGAGQYFVASIFDAATGLVTEIIRVTGRAGDTFQIVRAQESTPARAWTAGDVIGNFWTAGQAQAFFDNVRLGLTANTTFYVSNTGNDSNDGLSLATPWQTLQNAFNRIGSNWDLNGFTATIQLTDGTYAGALSNRPVSGGGATQIIVQGNVGTPANTVIAATGTALLADGNGSGFTVQFVDISSTLGHCIQASRNAQIYIGQSVSFGAAPNGAHIFCSEASNIRITQNYSIHGSAQCHIQIIDAASIAGPNTLAVAVTGNPNFSFATVSVINCSALYLQTPIYTGAATGKRYQVEANGVINTNGAGVNAYPGSIVGTVATGGQYI